MDSICCMPLFNYSFISKRRPLVIDMICVSQLGNNILYSSYFLSKSAKSSTFKLTSGHPDALNHLSRFVGFGSYFCSINNELFPLSNLYI